MSEAELDYYKILGVPRNASNIDICKAYIRCYSGTRSSLFSIIPGLSTKTKTNHTKNSASSQRPLTFSTQVRLILYRSKA